MLKSIIDSVTGQRLSVFGTIWVSESTFPIVNFMKSNYRSSTIYEKLATKLICI